jgi:two-component system sensor histidine kinase UhpB
MMHAAWLPVVLQGSYSEIYVMDCDTLRIVEANQSAATNLQYSAQDLIGRTLSDFSPNLTFEVLAQTLVPLRTGRLPQVLLDTVHIRKDSTSYPVEFRLLYCDASPDFFIAIGNDISDRYESADALRQSEFRFRAIASNTPGLVYQFMLKQDGSARFSYLSEGCHALLGIAPDLLQADSSMFVNLILPEDRPSYKESMMLSAKELKSWNWEGRIWIEEWKDIKWINLRSTPRELADRSIQWDGIMANITQSKLEEAEIKHSRAQLAELSAHIQTLKEQERTRIAQEIHDDLGGNLTAIKMALALLTKRLPDQNSELMEKAHYVDQLIDRSIEAAHRIAGDLRPSILDFGLRAAIDWQAKEFEKQVGIPCEVRSNQKDIELPADQATALFRIFQEALTNIAKHAHATLVAVKLARTNRSIRLEICDNGCGIAATDRMKPGSFGIRGMMERARALGGELLINTNTGSGTTLTIRIPL